MFKCFSSKKIVFQLSFVFLVFILISTIGMGVPVLILLERQTETQVQILLDQSNQTTVALIQNRNNQLKDLADLIAERPTLIQLLSAQADHKEVAAYLSDFRDNAGVDAILICRSQNVLAATGVEGDKTFCNFSTEPVFSVIENQVWWLTGTQLQSDKLGDASVIVGLLVQSIFNELEPQTGLSYFLFYEDQIMAASTGIDQEIPENTLTFDISEYDTLSMRNGDARDHRFIAAVVPILEESRFELIGLLNIGTFTESNRQLRNIFIIISFIVSLGGILLAIIISRQVSKPINQLAQSAASMRKGDLATPLVSSSKNWEIDQLTNTLEDARVGLKHSLDQLQMEKAWIESLFDSIVEGILTIDDNARITYASQAVLHLLGLDEMALLGQSIDNMFVTLPEEDLFSHQIPAPKQSCQISVYLNHCEVLLLVSASAFVPPDAGNATRALVIRDVTDEARIHRLLGDFLANITHEFRTPLSALSASVELLLDDLSELSGKEIEHLLQALNLGVINLQALIDNLIEASSIEAGRFKVNPQPVEFAPILTDAINTITPIVKKYGLRVMSPKLKQNFLVIADKRRTNQVLINLLSNAIKHSPQGGNIIISTTMLEKFVLIEIADEGKGVPKEQREHLFNRFTTPSKGGDSQLGLGLGLSVVKAIVEAQNGEVGFKESERGGAVFWFTLPISPKAVI